MKILQINKFDQLKGGSEQYIFSISALLKDQGHEVELFSMDRPEKIRPKLFWNRDANKNLAKVIKKFKPDVAHVHNIYHHFSPSILYTLKKHNVPVVMTLHDYKIMCPNYRMYNKKSVCEKCQGGKYYKCFSNDCFNDWARSAGASLESYLHNSVLGSYERHVKTFISPSKFLMNKFKEWGLEGKIEYLPNTTNITSTSREKGDYLLYFGRLEAEKGINFLVDVMRDLPQEKLIIVGKGNIKINNTENIKYLGFKSGHELKELVNRAKAVIVPSVWYENNPLNIIEAHALGTWVIGSKIGGIPELIKEEENGDLVEPGNKKDLIKKINNLKNKDINIKSQKIITPENHLKKLLDIYEQAI
ncbi:MAG: glycosyltransferase [Patescibacteria group bacterium]